MSLGESILKKIEAYFMEYGIESTPQDTETIECENQMWLQWQAYVQSSKAQQIALHGNGGKCDLYTLVGVRQRLCTLLHLKKCGAGGALALHTCVCLEALLIQWFQTRGGANSM